MEEFHHTEKNPILHLLNPTPFTHTPENQIIFTVSVVLLFTGYYIIGFMQYVALSGWLPSPSNTYLDSSMYFYGLVVPLFLMPNNITVYGFTAVYLSSHLLKDILVLVKLYTFQFLLISFLNANWP